MSLFSFGRRYFGGLSRPQFCTLLQAKPPTPFQPLPMSSGDAAAIGKFLCAPSYQHDRRSATSATLPTSGSPIAVVHTDQDTLVNYNGQRLFDRMNRIERQGHHVGLLLPFHSAQLLDRRPRTKGVRKIWTSLLERVATDKHVAKYAAIWNYFELEPCSSQNEFKNPPTTQHGSQCGDGCLIRTVRDGLTGPNIESEKGRLVSCAANLSRAIHIALIEHAIKSLPHFNHIVVSADSELVAAVRDLDLTPQLRRQLHVGSRYTGNEDNLAWIYDILTAVAPSNLGANASCGERTTPSLSSTPTMGRSQSVREPGTSSSFNLLFLDASIILDWPFDTRSFIRQASLDGYLVIILPRVMQEVRHGTGLSVIEHMKELSKISFPGIASCPEEWAKDWAEARESGGIEGLSTLTDSDAIIRAQAIEMLRHHLDLGNAVTLATFLTSDKGFACLWASLEQGLKVELLAAYLGQGEEEDASGEKFFRELKRSKHL